MLCPFEEIQQFLETKKTTERRFSTILAQSDIPELDFRRTLTVNGRTVMAIKIVEPCGFLLPSLLKDLQDFITVVSKFDFPNDKAKDPLIEQKQEHQSQQPQEAPTTLTNWQNDITLQIHDARIICLENPRVSATNAVALLVTMTLKNSSLTSMESNGEKCTVDNTWDLDISSLSVHVCPVQQISIRELSADDTTSTHRIVDKTCFKCHVKQEDLCSWNQKVVYSTLLECNSQLKHLEFYLSFVDLHIFNNIITNIRERFNPDESEPLKRSWSLQDSNFCSELCFEAILHCPNDYNEALQYCKTNESAFHIRLLRGDVRTLTDLLPCWMYHNYRELSLNKNANDADIIRALLLSENDIAMASKTIENIRSNRVRSRSQSLLSLSDVKTDETWFGEEEKESRSSI
ncbi:hypothetical protein RFI_21396, partial [Reticulomyxa filosa]